MSANLLQSNEKCDKVHCVYSVLYIIAQRVKENKYMLD